MNAAIPLNSYLSAPAEAVALSRFSQAASACFAPLISRRSGPGLFKWRAVRAIRNALVEKGCLDAFTVHLLWQWKTVAYMDDAGKVYLSAGLLQKSSAMSVLSVYCHELAHIKLSQRADYPAIKQLQREFTKQFRDHKLCQLLSPIEYYAMRQSRMLLADLTEDPENAGRKDRLQRLLADLDEKILLLEQELSKLAHPPLV